MRKFIIMGIQGSGKGTQAKLLAEELDLEHISAGDVFRWNVQHHTKLGAQVRRTMAAGRLVDDDLVVSVVRDRLAAHDWNFGFINPEALAVRLTEYHEQTRPVIEIFQRKAFVATIDATRPVNEVQAAIRERFAIPAPSRDPIS